MRIRPRRARRDSDEPPLDSRIEQPRRSRAGQLSVLLSDLACGNRETITTRRPTQAACATGQVVEHDLLLPGKLVEAKDHEIRFQALANPTPAIESEAIRLSPCELVDPLFETEVAAIAYMARQEEGRIACCTHHLEMSARVACPNDRRRMTKHPRNIVDIIVGHTDSNDPGIQVIFEYPIRESI